MLSEPEGILMPGARVANLEDQLRELSASEEKQNELSRRIEAACEQAQEAIKELSDLRQIDDEVMGRPITL